MTERDSVFPASALVRLWHWGPTKWLLGAAIPGAALFAKGWVTSRASKPEVAAVQEQVADPFQVLTAPRVATGDRKGDLINHATRIEGLEARLQQSEQANAACVEDFRRMRLDQIGFQAASSQPRAALRAETAEAARKAYLDLTKTNAPADTDEQRAYRRALETRPPR